MAPSYIHCYLLDCRQDLSNKGESSSQDRPAAGQYILVIFEPSTCKRVPRF